MSNLRKFIREYIEKLDEAFINSWVPAGIFKLLNIDFNSAQKLGEGDNGIAYRVGDKTIKVTYDAAEAEFAGVIKGHKLDHVANVHEVYEYDTEQGEDNRNNIEFSKSRYYWVIIKDYVPHQFGGDATYGDALRYFDHYQEKDFDYSSEAFDKMIKEYMDEYGPEEEEEEDDYEFFDTIAWFEFFKDLHVELRPTGILSVMDMKGSNMGLNEEGEPVYLELHIYKSAGYTQPVFTKLG